MLSAELDAVACWSTGPGSESFGKSWVVGITAFVVEGDLTQGFRRRRMRRTVDTMSGHYVVCGVGATTEARATAWRLLTLQEAAERLGRSERWLRERVRRREIAVHRIDGGALA